jgi:hypothetical protein
MPGIGATPAIGVTPDMGVFPDSRTPFGIGSVLLIRLTGIRCTRDASAVTQAIWSGCMIRTDAIRRCNPEKRWVVSAVAGV